MSRACVMPVIGQSSLWERRKSRLRSGSIIARRDFRRSHKNSNKAIAACA